MNVQYAYDEHDNENFTIHLRIFVGAILACVTACKCQNVEFVTLNRESIFEYEGSVNVIAQAPWDQVHLKPPQLAGWKIRGTVKIQRPSEHILAASVSVSPSSKSFHSKFNHYQPSAITIILTTKFTETYD